MLALLVLSACGRPPVSASLLLGGDVMLSRAGEPIFTADGEAHSPWGDLLTIQRSLTTDGFAVNLESPFGIIESHTPADLLGMNLCAGDELVALLQQGGVTLATNVNNHAADCSASEASHTASVLRWAGIDAQNVGYEVMTFRAGQQKVALISANETQGELDLTALSEELQRTRGESDLTLVSIHWGQEYQAGPTNRQQEIAQRLVDAGADVIWGHHPHVLQRMEWLRAASGEREGLVIYSLGNLLSDQWMLQDALRSALVRVEFANHRVTAVTVVPMKMVMKTKSLVFVQDAESVSWINERLNLEALTREQIPVEVYQEVKAP